MKHVALFLAAAILSCTGLTPTEFACNETTLCPTGYCCGTGGFCAADGDPTCGAPPPDAGPDAGLSDAGDSDAGQDAGAPDAGLDAGQDAGTDGGLDAGVHDAGSDAGIDAGQDAGLDAGSDAGLDAGSDGGSDAGVGVEAPSNLTYSANPATFTKGSAITNDAPSNGGGPVASYSISPAPPFGLSFSNATGILSGTPTAISPLTHYTVTATNAGGVTSAQLTVTVDDIPPSGLSYATNPVVATKGTAIASDAPTVGGGPVVSWAIAPALPTGLTLNSMTGILSGTPSVVAASMSYTVTATNSGGAAQVSLQLTVNDVAPANLRYATNPAIYTKGQTITGDAPTNSGGTVTSYTVSPSLPQGLALSPTTGVLSGEPTVLSATTSYTVAAANTGGSTSTSLTVTVKDISPEGLSYPTNPLVCAKGSSITSDVPTIAGGGAVVSYAVQPALPSGLLFNTANGVISGTPTVVTPQSAFTVSASNTGGAAQVVLELAVNDIAPADLTYATNPAVYTVDQAIAANAPSTSGGTPTLFQVAPALPAGLSLDMISGVLTGTPTAVSPQTPYTVTATNSGGSTQVTLTLTVNDVAPANLTYAMNPAVFTRGQQIANDTPSHSGGTIISYGISPALPAGLSLNTATGIVSGTPGALSTATGYTVTATNSAGSTQATLTITVNDVAPSGLTYASNPAVYTKGVLITNNAPTVGGGPVVSYGISPSLPNGLSLSTSSGVISGTPSALSTLTAYTVTATNSGGFTQVTLSLTVNDVAPMSLSYSANPAVYTKGVLISNNTPTISGGPVVSYSVSPGLPAGLSLNTSSGIISGTPSAISTQASYVITAANSGGSTQCTVNIQVNDAAPSSLTYPTNPASFIQNQVITPDVPTNSGGAVTAYAVSPALPSGLSFNTATGVVSGTPTAATSQAGYTVTATNSGGSTTALLTLTVTASGSYTTSGTTGGLAAGGSHACAIVNGGVVCWGSNYLGALGNNSSADSYVPGQVIGLTNGVQSIASGLDHMCAVVNGGAQCWGDNLDGQLGNNSTAQSDVPVQVTGLTSGVESLSGSFFHTCAVVNGGAQCWGENVSGQLGTGNTVSSLVPGPVTGLTGGVQAISTGNGNTCAIVNGAARCWGQGGALGNNSTASSTLPVQVTGLTSGVQAISVSNAFACALVNGAAECWGSNTYGQLGNNSTVTALVPVAVQGLSSGVQAIAAGYSSVYAIVNGSAWSWGYNGGGELGIGSTGAGPVLVPTQVVGLTSGVQVIAAGEQYACALVNGGVHCWGENYDGELGNNTTVNDSTVAQQVTGLTGGVEAVVAGTNETCAIVNGGAQCWGDNSNGELGNNTTVNSSLPVHVTGLTSGVVALAVGGYHACAIVGGGAQCWGSGGALGNNSVAGSTVPVQVAGLSSGVQALQAGDDYSCAIVNGGAQCWGTNFAGQLGNNSTVSSPIPVQVIGLTGGVEAIAANGFGPFVCALVNGGVQCWGNNVHGTLGNNSTAVSAVPVQVSGLGNGVQAIGSGSSGACAIANGGVQCWGDNTGGALGNNSTTYSLVPVQVSGLTAGAQAISGSEDGACAIVNGGAQCWGLGGEGGLGDNSGSNSAVPVLVTGDTSGVQLLTSGGEQSCVLSGGGVECWGFNGYGELGNGTTGYSLVPVVVGPWAQ